MRRENPIALHARTRRVYKKQHRRISADARAFSRISSSYTPEKMQIPAGWFAGKTALDAGCGNIGSLIVSLVKLGCREVHACDIGLDWVKPLTRVLERQGILKTKVSMRSGNVLRLPYRTGTFDFVAVNGVLLHLKNKQEIQRGFAEGARVCKIGGYYFTSWGPSGGLIQGKLMPAARSYYRENKEFRRLIDNISPEMIHRTIDKICADSRRLGGEEINGECLKSLFGIDFSVFLQNFIQAPKWWSNECPPAYVESLYKRHGFRKIRRLNEFVKRGDIRKFFAPLHYDRRHPISKVLYGDGYVKYIGTKR